MASTLTAGRTAIAELEPWREAELKTKSPYGLPITDTCQSCRMPRNDLFCGISPVSMRALDRIKHASSYPGGALIFMEGEAPRGVYILCQGRAKVLTTNSEGRTLILKIAQPGEILGLNSVIAGRPQEFTVETWQPSQLAFISREDFLLFIREHGDACLRVAQHLGRDCHTAYDFIRSIGLSDSASEKLARFLLEWSGDGQERDGMVRVKLALTHEEIAQLISCSRETVSRTLSDFKKKGVLELSGSTMVIRNKRALQGLANA
jgi:CRP/FNR family transcriptional regulator, cyclic AMP receptor protein